LLSVAKRFSTASRARCGLEWNENVGNGMDENGE
jgi:hypothetical protein